MRFSEVAVSEFYLDTYNSKKDIKQAIKDTLYMGSFTNTSGGLREIMQNQFSGSKDRVNFPNVAIVITDGVSTIDANYTIPDAEKARAAGIEIITLGISDQVDMNEIKSMSSLPQVENKNWFRIESFQVLDSVNIAVRESACTNAGSSGKYSGTP